MPLIQLQNQLQTIHARLVPATWGATMALPQLSNKQQAPQYSFPSALQSRYLFGNSTAYAWLLSENVAPKCIGLKMVRREVVPTVAGTFGATLGSEHGWTHDHTDMFSLRSQRNTQPSRRKAIHVPPHGPRDSLADLRAIGTHLVMHAVPDKPIRFLPRPHRHVNTFLSKPKMATREKSVQPVF